MSAFSCVAPTNDNPNSISLVPGYDMPARAFFFIIVEEPGRDGFLVRKIYASPHSPYLANMQLSPLQALTELVPERHGLAPKMPTASVTVAEHVMGNNQSQYISTSSIFPDGSPRFEGRNIIIDIERARRSGARLVSTEEIITDLNRYKAENPHLAKRIDRIANYVRDIDKEVLIEGQRVPANAVFTPESLTTTRRIAGSARAVQVIGIAFTAYDLTLATDESIKIGSARPITAEAVRQAGGWGAAWAGFKLGGVAGAALGIKTGPGALVTGLVGGIVVGGAGYFGADWVADHIYEN